MGKASDSLLFMHPDCFCRWVYHTISNVTKGEKMKKNMGSIDRTVRTIIAVIVAVLYFTGAISGTVALILGILAAVFLLTSFIGTCPLYLPFGLSTRKTAK